MTGSRAASNRKAMRPTGRSPPALRKRVEAFAAPSIHASVLEEARRAGLLRGGKSEHVSFRAPPALIKAAKRETGVMSTSELGLLAFAMLARPDPVVAYMKRNRGKLGAGHALEH